MAHKVKVTWTMGFKRSWMDFWTRLARRRRYRPIATRLATWFVPSFYEGVRVAQVRPKGYVSRKASISHEHLELGSHCFLAASVLVFQDRMGGPVTLGDRVHIHRDTIIQTGSGGSVTIGADTHIQPRCQVSAYKGSIRIGQRVEIAPNCAFFPYDHGISPDKPIREQPLWTKGGIIVDDDAWLGFGVIVLDGVRIGKGAIAGAGSVVTQDIPDYAIAVGVPARVVRFRSELASA